MQKWDWKQSDWLPCGEESLEPSLAQRDGPFPSGQGLEGRELRGLRASPGQCPSRQQGRWGLDCLRTWLQAPVSQLVRSSEKR